MNFNYCNVSGNHSLTNYNGIISSFNSFKNNNLSISIDNCDFHVNSIDLTSFFLFGPDSFSNGSLNLNLTNSNFKSNNGGQFFQIDLPVTLTFNNIYYDIDNILNTTSLSNQITINTPSFDIVRMSGNGNNFVMQYNGLNGNNDFFSFYSDIDNWSKNGESLNIVPSTGHVGIGITNPSSELEVNGDISANIINCNQLNTDYSLTFTLNVNINLSTNDLQTFYFSVPRNCRLSNIYFNSNSTFTQAIQFTIKLIDDNDNNSSNSLKSTTFNYLNNIKAGKNIKYSLISENFIIDDYENRTIQIIKNETTQTPNTNIMVTLDLNY